MNISVEHIVRTDRFVELIDEKHVLAYADIYEPETTDAFIKALGPKQLVVDVGANYGWYSLLAASLGVKRIVAFEPHRGAAETLAGSIGLNGFTNIELRRQALMEHAGSIPFWESTVSSTSSAVRTGDRPVRTDVEAVTLDECFPTETIDVLKIDVEGAESDVLLGGMKMLTEHRISNIIMEWNEDSWFGTGERQPPVHHEALLEFLKTEFDFQTIGANRLLTLWHMRSAEHDWQAHYNLKPGDVYVEVGAFEGNTSVTLDPGVRQFLIEPSPPQAARIEALDRPNIVVVRKAVTKSKGQVAFMVEGAPEENHLKETKYVRDNMRPGFEVQVEGDTLEGILDGLGVDHVDLLAADCEGCEFDLVDYGGLWLAEHRIRNLAIAAYHVGGGPERVSEVLRKHGYETTAEYGRPPYNDGIIVYGWL